MAIFLLLAFILSVLYVKYSSLYSTDVSSGKNRKSVVATYHYLQIEDDAYFNSPQKATYTITKKQFLREINWYKKNNYGFNLINNYDQEKNCIYLTIDGAEASWLEVDQFLFEQNIFATFFMVSDWIGKDQFLDEKKLQYLSVRQSQQGSNLYHIGSHSKSHQNFLRKSSENDFSYTKRIFTEMMESKEKIEKITGIPIVSFSFPYGVLNDRNLVDLSFKIANKIGYRYVRTTLATPVTSEVGFLSHQYEAKRSCTNLGIWLSVFRYKYPLVLTFPIWILYQLDCFLSSAVACGFVKTFKYYCMKKINLGRFNFSRFPSELKLKFKN